MEEIFFNEVRQMARFDIYDLKTKSFYAQGFRSNAEARRWLQNNIPPDRTIAEYCVYSRIDRVFDGLKAGKIR